MGKENNVTHTEYGRALVTWDISNKLSRILDSPRWTERTKLLSTFPEFWWCILRYIACGCVEHKYGVLLYIIVTLYSLGRSMSHHASFWVFVQEFPRVVPLKTDVTTYWNRCWSCSIPIRSERIAQQGGVILLILHIDIRDLWNLLAECVNGSFDEDAFETEKP